MTDTHKEFPNANGWRRHHLGKPRASVPYPFSRTDSDGPTYWYTDDDLDVLRRAGVAVDPESLRPDPDSLAKVLAAHGLKPADLQAMNCRQIVQWVARLPKTSRSKEAQQQLTWQAIALLQEHPEWPDRRVAVEIKKPPSWLSRNKAFQDAKLAFCKDRMKGYRTSGRDRTREVEAIDPEPDPD